MARLVCGMNQSLDGYVDHDAFDPGPDAVLFRHFVDQVRAAAAGVYGRRMYEVMRYWDDDHTEWDDAERDFAAAWRGQRKWVVSRTLTSVGPNATLIAGDPQALVRDLKAQLDGEIEVCGTLLAAGLSELIDEYRLYLHPVVLGGGKPFFAAPRPPLRLTSSERIGETVIRLTYAPA